MSKTPIPEEITYFQKPVTKTTISSEGYSYKRLKEEEVEIRESYVGDTRNSTTQQTGAAFISGYEGSTVATKPNEPVQYVRLINVGGGRHYRHTWHVLIDETYFVEMTDSTLMDAVRNSKAVDGKLYGPFIWARVSSGLRLVRVGSLIYRDLVEQTERIQSKAIRRTKLVVGNVYQDESGSFAIFLGDVDYEEFEDTAPQPAYNPYRYGQPQPPKPAGQYQITEYKRRQLWLNCDDYKDRSYKNELAKFEESKETGTAFGGSHYAFQIHTSRRIVKDLGPARSIPENPLEVYHEIALLGFHQKNDPQQNVDYARYSYKYFSLRAAGTPELRVPDLEYLYDHITQRITK